MINNSNAIPTADDMDQLEDGGSLADQVLEAASEPATLSAGKPPLALSEEIADSNQLAETLQSLQSVIERNAANLETLKKQLKEKRELLGNVFENDVQLSAAEEEVDKFKTKLTERRSQLQSDPQVTSLKTQIGELTEQKKEIEESLSNHLVNYYSLTNSRSFDTSDGDQWDFVISARVKGRGKN